MPKINPASAKRSSVTTATITSTRQVLNLSSAFLGSRSPIPPQDITRLAIAIGIGKRIPITDNAEMMISTIEIPRIASKSGFSVASKW